MAFLCGMLPKGTVNDSFFSARRSGGGNNWLACKIGHSRSRQPTSFILSPSTSKGGDTYETTHKGAFA